MCKEVFKVTLSDGTNTVTLLADKVEWPLATDGFVRVYTAVSLDTAQILDRWDGGKVLLDVEIKAQSDTALQLPPCPPDRLDYDSISGKGYIKDPTVCGTDAEGNTVCGGWQYEAGTGRAVIPILFTEWE